MTGLKMKLYVGEAGTAVASLDEVDICRDVNFDSPTGTADGSTRASRFRKKDLTLTDLSLDIELKYVPGNDEYEMFRDAWLTATPIAIAALSGDKATNGSEGPYGDWIITNFGRPEPLEDTVVVNITAELHDFDGTEPWHETSGS